MRLDRQILIGIDDTDTLETPGTNQLAKALVRAVSANWSCQRIVRHQLLFDPGIPYTSKNGSASVLLAARGECQIDELTELCERMMRDWFVHGSDPGLCIVSEVPEAVVRFGRRCQREIVDQNAARAIAAEYGLYLQGFGGTEGGVIGALAAIGLASTSDDGRVVQHGEWPDDLSGSTFAAAILERGIDILCIDSNTPVLDGLIDVGRHLRPNRRAGRTVLYAQQVSSETPVQWKAVKRV